MYATRDSIESIQIPGVGFVIAAISLTQAVTGKDSNSARTALHNTLHSEVETTRSKAEAVLHRKYVMPGFSPDSPTWVVTFNEALQLVCDVLPDKYTSEIKQKIYGVFQRYMGGDSSLHAEVEANRASGGVLHELARDGLGFGGVHDEGLGKRKKGEDELAAKVLRGKEKRKKLEEQLDRERALVREMQAAAERERAAADSAQALVREMQQKLDEAVDRERAAADRERETSDKTRKRLHDALTLAKEKSTEAAKERTRAEKLKKQRDEASHRQRTASKVVSKFVQSVEQQDSAGLETAMQFADSVRHVINRFDWDSPGLTQSLIIDMMQPLEEDEE